MNKTLVVILLVVANLILAASYITIIAETSETWQGIEYIAIAGGTHIALCCITSLIFFFKGKREFAAGFLISAAVLLIGPSIIIMFA